LLRHASRSPPDTAAPRLPSGVPDFFPHDMGWASDGVEFFPSREKSSNPSHDPRILSAATAFRPNAATRFSPCRRHQEPILQPWAARRWRSPNDEILGGKESFEAMSRCWPGGVPGMMLFTAQPAYFVQLAQRGDDPLFARAYVGRHVI
jgi:hypothetical protein